ncbi:hypothetical protein O6H91_11G038400 [Diphasiastrum complanatum]|uniref:Uncharacterized protein n=1 Tax=Diphasiastrum complanatum TaxID=34168 RepID=A0ACC2C8B2_DIPCM|nr:hypothetical protein O6H91_11G038400 [Diphasiastrum complanatum]
MAMPTASSSLAKKKKKKTEQKKGGGLTVAVVLEAVEMDVEAAAFDDMKEMSFVDKLVPVEEHASVTPGKQKRLQTVAATPSIVRRTRSQINGSHPPSPLVKSSPKARRQSSSSGAVREVSNAGACSRREGSSWVAAEQPAENCIYWEELQEVLMEEFPGRASEIGKLLRILGQPWDVLPPVFVYGGPATGKTSVVVEVLKQLRRPFAYASCRSCHSPRILFESIVNQLTDHERVSNNNYGSFKKCDRVAEFVRLLPDACEQAIARSIKKKQSPVISYAEKGKPTSLSEDSMWALVLQMLNADLSGSNDAVSDLNSPCDSSTLLSFSNSHVVYLVIDNVELLRAWAGGLNLFNVLLKLCELTRLPNLGIILISNVGLDGFMSGTGFREPQPLYFRGYTDEELHQILLKGQPNADLYSSFLHAALKPLTRVTRRVTELADSLEPLFVKYYEPVVHGVVFPDDQGKRKLFSLLQPHLKNSLAQTLSIPNAFPMGNSKNDPTGGTKKVEFKRAVDSTSNLDFHLSLCSKYLLLAAHICSTNPATLDASIFDAGGAAEKQKRRRKSFSSMDKRNQELQEKHLKGPGSFPLERLLAIFHCISVGPIMIGSNKASLKLIDVDEGEPMECSADVLMQLSTLVRVNLILKGCSDPLEGSARYRCNANDELMQKIARSVHFPLSKFLYYNTQL